MIIYRSVDAMRLVFFDWQNFAILQSVVWSYYLLQLKLKINHKNSIFSVFFYDFYSIFKKPATIIE